MAKHTLDGPAKRKVLSLAAALDADDTALINQRWGGLRRMLGQKLDTYSGQIRGLLTDDQAARLTRMTSFEG